jgi:hypothetical protein
VGVSVRAQAKVAAATNVARRSTHEKPDFVRNANST